MLIVVSRNDLSSFSFDIDIDHNKVIFFPFKEGAYPHQGNFMPLIIK